VFVYSPSKVRSSEGAPAGKKHLRDHNRALLLRNLWESPEGFSRAELARNTGLSPATVSAITAKLVTIGVASESKRRSSRGGRPATPILFEPNFQNVIGIEMGSSHISAVRTNLLAEIQERLEKDIDVQNNPEETFAVICEFIGVLTASAPCPILGIGIGVPSPVELSPEHRLSSQILPKWQNENLAARVSQKVELPVMIDNDANLGAIAEQWWGAGRGSNDLVYIKASTGIGAGFIVNGDIYRGAFGIAGEIGHITVLRDGPLCRCGLSGCLEAMVGTPAILQRAREKLSDDQLQLSTLIERSNNGCEISRSIIQESGTWIGEVVANLIKTVNPSRIVLGGRISTAGPVLLEALRETVYRRLPSSWAQSTEIHLSEVEREPVVLGAATLLIQAALTDPRILVQKNPPPNALLDPVSYFQSGNPNK
jgi:predicted NBD/HSP70 family sugar kinase